MGYVGVPPQSGFITTAKQRVTSSTNNYVDLDHSISSLADVIVWVNFVKQDSTNLSLTTSTRITLGGTLVSSDIVEIAYLGKAVATQTPDTGTVTNDMLAGSIANSKLANSSITLNGSAVSLGGSASVDNTPAFFVSGSGTQSIPNTTVTKIQFNSESLDTDNAFDSSTNYRFTPQVAGFYVIGMNVRLNSSADFDQNFIQINKNSSIIFQSYYGNTYYNGHSGQLIIQLNGSSDYIEFYIHQNSGGAVDLPRASTETFAYGYRVLGA
jgi:hypothetical protein